MAVQCGGAGAGAGCRSRGRTAVLRGRTIQHAGQYFARSGVHHVDVGEIPSNSDRNRSAVDRDVTGVTGACLAQRAEVWRELGGFDPMLPSSFNDVDYCMRIRRHGYRIVQCNSARLFHFESKSRNEVTPAGFARLMHTGGRTTGCGKTTSRLIVGIQTIFGTRRGADREGARNLPGAGRLGPVHGGPQARGRSQLSGAAGYTRAL